MIVFRDSRRHDVVMIVFLSPLVRAGKQISGFGKIIFFAVVFGEFQQNQKEPAKKNFCTIGTLASFKGIPATHDTSGMSTLNIAVDFDAGPVPRTPTMQASQNLGAAFPLAFGHGALLVMPHCNGSTPPGQVHHPARDLQRLLYKRMRLSAAPRMRRVRHILKLPARPRCALQSALESHVLGSKGDELLAIAMRCLLN